MNLSNFHQNIKRTIKYTYRIYLVILILFTIIAFTNSNYFSAVKLAFNFWNPVSISEYRIKSLTTEEYIKQIKLALTEENYEDAQNLVALAQEYNRQLPEELINRTKENFFAKSYRNSKDFALGAITGKGDNIYSIVGSITSDFFVIGDVHDLITEGTKYANGEDFDLITISLAGVGIFTFTTPLIDSGLSVLKTSIKLGKISKPLLKIVTNASKNVINLKIFKQEIAHIRQLIPMPSYNSMKKIITEIDYAKIIKGDFTEAGTTFQKHMPNLTATGQKKYANFINEKAVVELENIAFDTGAIFKLGGLSTTMRAMHYAEDTKDLKKIRLIATKLGDKTATALKLFGKSLFKLGKLLYWLMTVFISFICWIFTTMRFFYFFVKSIVRFFSRLRTH